jgi:hypothetical protein
MKNFLRLAASILVLLAAFVAAQNDPLPSGFIGHWSVNVSTFATTVVGPMTLLNFTVLPLPGSNGTRWLMRHDFAAHYALQGSKQQFWVSSVGSGASATSNNTYCGYLNDFIDKFGPAPIEVNLTEAARASNMIQWNLGNNNFPFNGTWTMRLSDDNTQLHSHFVLPDEMADHLVAQYTLVSADPWEFIDDETKLMLLRSKEANPNEFQPPCNWTFTMPPQPSSATASAQRPATKKSKGGCPLGFGGSVASMSERLRASEPVRKVMPEAAVRLGHQYEHCHLVNDEMQYVVAWDWKTDTKTVNIAVSARPPPQAGLEASTQYVALGFNPQWPYMQGMDIVMGYMGAGGGDVCIRSMFAEYSVGTPVDNPSQELTGHFLGFNITANTLEMRFERPWNTGHQDLNMDWTGRVQAPVLAFAMGNAATNCTSRPHYHFGQRGVYGMLWNDPLHSFPEHMKCIQ